MAASVWFWVCHWCGYDLGVTWGGRGYGLAAGRVWAWPRRCGYAAVLTLPTPPPGLASPAINSRYAGRQMEDYRG